MVKKRGEAASAAQKVRLPEEHLIEQGKFKELYERIGQRKLRKWDPEYKVYKIKSQDSADLNELNSDALNLLETCSRGTITQGKVTAYIVRYAGGDEQGTYGVEIVSGSERIDAFYDDIDPIELLTDVKKIVAQHAGSAKEAPKSSKAKQTLAETSAI